MKFTTKEQFLEHTNRHIDNVSELSSVLLSFMLEDDSVKEKYGLDTDKKIEDFSKRLTQVVGSHDFAKLEDSPEFLEKHNLDRPFYDFLFEKTGVELIGEDRELIQKMNDLDDLTTTILTKKVGFSMEERDLYRIIEHTADIVERGCNPLTKYEFGREISRASEYKKGYASENEIKLMERLESYYDDEIKPRQELFLETLKAESNRQEIGFKDETQNIRKKEKKGLNSKSTIN